MIQKVYPWLLAFRFKTLIAAFVPVLVGSALSHALSDQFVPWVSGFALMSAFCIQIATNLFNDAIDFEKGADTQERIGPQRVTQSGLLNQKQVWFMALFFLLLAAGFGLPLVLRGGVPIVGLGLISLFLAYGYTGGPFPLAYLGLGDLFVILFFGLFAVGGTFYLHTLELNLGALIAGLQIGFLSTILIAVNNLRDSDTDKNVGKRTLAVLLGDRFVRWEILLLTALSYLLILYFLVVHQKLYVLLAYALLPLAGLVVGFVFGLSDKQKLNKVLALAALHQLLFAIVFSVGLLL